MEATQDISLLAGKAYQQFERGERGDGESFTRLKDSAPDWLRDLVRNAHGDMLPDDWRYQTIRAALGFIHDNEPDDLDDGHEFADDNVDTYNGARLAWLSSNLSRAGYCDDALDEFGPSEGTSDGIFHTIGLGQYMESLEVWASVVRSLCEYADGN